MSLKKLMYFSGIKKYECPCIQEVDVDIINFDPFDPVSRLRQCWYNNMSSILSYIYRILIFTIITLEPLCILIYSIKNKSIVNIPKFCFLFISPCQFLIANSYFKKEHFWDIFKHLENTRLTYFNNENRIITVVLLLSIISIILTLCILVQEIVNNSITNEPIYINFGYFGILLSIISYIYGRIIIFTNIILFFLVFSSHKNELENTATILTNKDWLKSEQFIVSDLCYQILKIKTRLENSISHLETIYTYSTMLGTVGIGVFFQDIDDINNNVFIMICFGIFAIVQVYFVYFMYNLTTQRKNLLKIIQSSKFTKAFLKRNGKNKDTPKDPFKTLIMLQRFSKVKGSIPMVNLSQLKLSPPTPTISRTPDWVRDNGSSIDWIVLYTILKERWISFSFFGLTFEDGNAIKKGLALSAMLVAANSLNI